MLSLRRGWVHQVQVDERHDPRVTEPLPETLFHYTNAAGLLGILTTELIWATDTRFLNDPAEGLLGLDLVLDELERTHQDPPDGTSANEWEELTFGPYKALLRDELAARRNPVYVSCFCEAGDLLSQWRAYGGDHGYAIELEASRLTEAFVGDWVAPWSGLHRVRYGAEQASDLVAEAMGLVMLDTNLGHYGVHAHYMALQLSARVAAIKQGGFDVEREWRLVVAEEDRHEETEFRANKWAVVPYINVRCPLDAIVSVRVGPGEHATVRKQGVERLLTSLGLSTSMAKLSELLLRT
jgi:hypothetical protein